jgi:hypothetical protein
MIALSKRESAWIIIFICVSILALGMLWLVVPQYKIFIQQSQKLASLQSSSETMNQQKASMVQGINRYKFLINDSRKKVGYTFSDENPEQRIKGFLRELLTLSSSTGNELVSILPSQTNEKVSIRTTTLEEDLPPTAKPTDAKAEEKKESQQRFVAVKEKSLPLSTTNMDMQIRGSYKSILGFVGALAKHNALLKVESFQLKYEAVDTYGSSQGMGDLGFNAEKPIRLTLKIKLYLLEAGFKP